MKNYSIFYESLTNETRPVRRSETPKSPLSTPGQQVLKSHPSPINVWYLCVHERKIFRASAHKSQMEALCHPSVAYDTNNTTTPLLPRPSLPELPEGRGVWEEPRKIRDVPSPKNVPGRVHTGGVTTGPSRETHYSAPEAPLPVYS